MPRPLRIQFDHALYLIRSLGNRSEPIFKDSEDRDRFLVTLEQVCAKTGWMIHAYCLLDNEFDLVVETHRANLVLGMKWFLGSYTMRYNRRHRVSGHLFAGRYRSWLVDPTAPGYLAQACEWVHLRPGQSELANAQLPLTEFPWSSAHFYALPPDHRPRWLQTARLFGDLGIANDDSAGPHQFSTQLEQRRGQDQTKTAAWSGQGWCLGSEEFQRQMLSRIPRSGGRWPNGPQRKEAAALQAEDLVGAELRGLGWSEPDLERTAKGAAEKVEIARRLRRETAVSLKWIAQRLRMGSWTYVANLIYAPAPKPRKTAPRPLRRKQRVRTVPAPYQSPRVSESPAPEAPEEFLPVHCL